MYKSEPPTGEKIFAGVLLIAAIAFAISTVLAYFPNKMPEAGKGDAAWYNGVRYKMTLIENTGTETKASAENAEKKLIHKKDSLIEDQTKMKQSGDSIQFKKDSLEIKNLGDSLEKLKKGMEKIDQSNEQPDPQSGSIHLNTIMLILVASMGFLGNMIYVASSFTSFVGNGTFEKSWALWYFVKPFTAAALSVVVFFVIKAGFMGGNTDSSNTNLYGVLAFAALTGLFTDRAALKLKEIFEVIFKPKDERDNKLTDMKIKITGITPAKLDPNNKNNIQIKGENLDKIEKPVIKINDKPVTSVSISGSIISFEYTIEPADRAKSDLPITITDAENKEQYKGKLTL